MTRTALSTVDISQHVHVTLMSSTFMIFVISTTSPQHHTNQLSHLQPRVFDRNVVYIFLLKFAFQDLKPWSSIWFTKFLRKPREAEVSTTPPSLPSCFCLSPVTSHHPYKPYKQWNSKKENAPKGTSEFLKKNGTIAFWSNKRLAWSPFCCWTSGHKTCQQISQESVETPTGSFTWSSHADFKNVGKFHLLPTAATAATAVLPCWWGHLCWKPFLPVALHSKSLKLIVDSSFSVSQRRFGNLNPRRAWQHDASSGDLESSPEFSVAPLRKLLEIWNSRNLEFHPVSGGAVPVSLEALNTSTSHGCMLHHVASPFGRSRI